MILICAACLHHRAFSQSLQAEYTKNGTYVELFGQGLLYTLNYDYRFTEHLGARIGFTHFTTSEARPGRLDLTGIPAMGEFLAGSNGHYFEIALGVFPVYGKFDFDILRLHKERDWGFIWTGTIGLRYQPQTDGLMFRMCMTPLFTSEGVMMWGGVSFGYAF